LARTGEHQLNLKRVINNTKVELQGSIKALADVVSADRAKADETHAMLVELRCSVQTVLSLLQQPGSAASESGLAAAGEEGLTVGDLVVAPPASSAPVAASAAAAGAGSPAEEILGS
jgi:hypothetical protein